MNKSTMSESQKKSTQSVLIVGGGNVGLSFALLLAKRGIRTTILEKNSYPTISPDDDIERDQYLDSRNTALSRRTVQIYQEIDLWKELISHACRIDEVHISELGSFGHAKLIKQEEGVESFGYVMENAWLGRKLLTVAQSNDLINVMDNTQVTFVSQNAEAVTLTIKTNDVESQIVGDLLVACDGSDSTVRQLLNISVMSHDYQQMGIVGVVTTDQPHSNVGIERFSPAGPLAILPLTDVTEQGNVNYRRSVVWICPKGEEKRYLEDDQYFLQTLQDTFGNRAGKFLKVGRRGAYPLTKILASHQVKGRCVIMGNAAHTLHPVAGQGFNLCMRDADTLAKMLSGQMIRGKDIGNSQLLHTYEEVRKKDQKRVIKFCDAVVHGFTNPNPTLKFFRNLALIAFDKVPKVKPLVATYAMGLKS